MMLLSTGSLSFVRDNMKSPYKVAFLPKSLRNAAPIGGASLILPKGNTPERQAAAWTLINWLISPEIAGEWSRFTGYFSPRKAAYELPDMQKFIADHPDAKIALDQLKYAVPWFDTFNTVAVRKAMEDQVQAIFSAKTNLATRSPRLRRRPMNCCAPMSSRPRSRLCEATRSPSRSHSLPFGASLKTPSIRDHIPATSQRSKSPIMTWWGTTVS